MDVELQQARREVVLATGDVERGQVVSRTSHLGRRSVDVAPLEFECTFREVRRFRVLRFSKQRFDELIQYCRELFTTFIAVATEDPLGLLQEVDRFCVLMQCCGQRGQMAQTLSNLKMSFAERLNADF